MNLNLHYLQLYTGLDLVIGHAHLRKLSILENKKRQFCSAVCRMLLKCEGKYCTGLQMVHQVHHAGVDLRIVLLCEQHSSIELWHQSIQQSGLTLEL